MLSGGLPMNKEITAAWIAGICAIIAAIIGVFSYDIRQSNKDLIIENTELTKQNNDWESSYNDLKKQFDSLHNENDTLSEEINTLKNTVEEYTSSTDENNLSLNEKNESLLAENESLKDEINQLKNELENMKSSSNNSDSLQNNTLPESNMPSEETGKRVSVFNLDTFKGKTSWYNHSYYTNIDVFTDTYGNEYLTAYVGLHSGRDLDYSYNPTYLLDNKYSTCEGEIAWSKSDKNSKETAWIEFYSGNELIYTTEKITVDSRPLPFSFSVKGIEKLTIVTNATGSKTAWVVYPYLDFVQ